MYLIFGQIGVSKSDSEVQKLMRRIEADGCGTTLTGCIARHVSLTPMSWCVCVDFPSYFVKNWNLDGMREVVMLTLVSAMGRASGPAGKYYFRGSDSSEFTDFWDNDPEKMSEFDGSVFSCLPLSITIAVDCQAMVDIYMDWVNRFVQEWYSSDEPITPFDHRTVYSDTLRRAFAAILELLGVQGDWKFRMSYDEMENPSRDELEAAVNLPELRQIAN